MLTTGAASGAPSSLPVNTREDCLIAAAYIRRRCDMPTPADDGGGEAFHFAGKTARSIRLSLVPYLGGSLPRRCRCRWGRDDTASRRIRAHFPDYL